MKKVVKKITLLLLVFSIGVGVTLLYTNNKYKVYEEEEPKQIKKHVDTISMMLETEANSGNYEMTTASGWPTDGYVFNATLSKCENGGELSWDDTNKRILMSGNVSDKCYVYFDVYVPPTIADFCNSGDTLATCVKNFGDQGSEISNIYIHNSSLTNGAGDNSYRYAGGDYVLTEAGKATGATMMIGYNNTVTTALIDFYCNGTKQYVGYASSCSTSRYYLIKEDTTQYTTYNEALNKAVEKGYLTKDNVKNFVCFGSTASPCPTENLYRIIGVFGNNVKLIKWDYAKSSLLGTDGDFSQEYSYYFSGEQGESPSSNSLYYWNNTTQINTWSTSNLNKVNLNTNFVNNIGGTWANKIATTTWKVGGGSYDYIVSSVPKTAYQYELGTNASTTTYSAKIGLMYVTDYYYSASPNKWTLAGNDLDYADTYASVKGENWLYGGGWDWTISRFSVGSGTAFVVYDFGMLGYNDVNSYSGARPSFNLESAITYVSGSGSADDPMVIN